jgi:hypothetical protein
VTAPRQGSHFKVRDPDYQPPPLALHAPMAFRYVVVGTLEDERLRRMQASKIGCVAGGLRPLEHLEQVLGFPQGRARFFKEGSGLLLHKSMPWARMAYMSGMRGSLQEPAG